MLKIVIKFFLGGVFSQGLNFITLILISRFVGLNKFGEFSIILAAHLLVVQIADFGLNIAFVKNKILNEINRQYQNLLIIKILGTVILLVMCLYYSDVLIGQVVLTEGNKWLLKFSIACAPLFVLYYSANAFYQARGDYNKIIIIGVIFATLRMAVVLCGYLIFDADNLEYYVYAYFAPVIFPVMHHLFSEKINLLNVKYDFGYAKKLFSLSRWTFMSSILVTIVSQYGVLQISKYSNSKEVGIYTVANNMAMVIPLITNSIYAVILSEINNINHAAKDFIKSIFGWIKYILPILIFMSIGGGIFLNLFYEDDFFRIWCSFAILMIGYLAGLIASPLSVLLLNNRSAVILTAINLMQLIILLMFGGGVVMRLGAIGASCILMINNLVGLIIIISFVMKIKKNENCNTF